MIAAMNELGYAACALGNHEFNYGLDLLDAALAGANFPAVSCNIFKPDGSFYFKPWIVLERALARRGRRRANAADRHHRLHARRKSCNGTRAIWPAARRRSASPKRRAGTCRACARGVDLVVALCHSGISRKRPPSAGRGERRAGAGAGSAASTRCFSGISICCCRARILPGIDGVDVDARRAARRAGLHAGILGQPSRRHRSHARARGVRLARRRRERRRAADLRAQRRPRRADRRRRSESARRRAAGARGDAGLCALAGRRHRLADQFLFRAGRRRSLGADRQRRAELVRQAPRRRRCRRCGTSPILSAAAPFKCGGRGGPDYYTDVAAGPIAIKNVADLYLYPNGLRVVKVDGATLREWLERSAALFRRIDPKSQRRTAAARRRLRLLQFRRRSTA